ncbi:MAG: hypothetical protein DMD81_00610 [Candidatus Rokuibacteriota bacterium]|nr:MAG: hypothetical protein DMD81_00610 [Candidatus Rokubacteria bacterium]
MQVIAFSTPSYPDWKWRIVNYAGEMIEESRETYPSIALAVADGNRRLREVDHDDVSVRPSPYRRSYRR